MNYLLPSVALVGEMVTSHHELLWSKNSFLQELGVFEGATHLSDQLRGIIVEFEFCLTKFLHFIYKNNL
jgi:hypothetical protein